MFKSRDGKGFSNRPAMRSHDAHVAAKHPTQPQGFAKTPGEEPAQPDLRHSAMAGDKITCPHCGGEFTPDEVASQGASDATGFHS